MKKFITIFVLCFISIMSYGQYKYSDAVYEKVEKVDKFSQYPSINDLSNDELMNMNFTNLYEYKVAKDKIRKGTINSIVGLGLETIGSVMLIGTVNSFDIDENVGIIISSGLMIGGFVEALIGVFQIYNGKSMIDDLKTNIAFRGNGVIISF